MSDDRPTRYVARSLLVVVGDPVVLPSGAFAVSLHDAGTALPGDRLLVTWLEPVAGHHD